MIEAEFTKKLDAFSLTARMSDSGFILLTGRNGAGKSTFIYSLLGLYAVDSGGIKLNGKEIAGLPIDRRRIGFVNQSTFFPHLDVDRHILWGLRHRQPVRLSLNEIKERLGITFSGRVGKLSLGQRIRVALATSIIASPEALLIDEAISNLSERFEVLGELRSLAEEGGMDIVYVSQDPSEARAASHHYVVEGGIMSRLF